MGKANCSEVKSEDTADIYQYLSGYPYLSGFSGRGA